MTEEMTPDELPDALGDLMAADEGGSEETLAELARAGVDPTALSARLQAEGADAFGASWNSLLACVARKHERLPTGG